MNPRGHQDDAQLAGEGDALAFWSPTGAAVELLDQRDDGLVLTHLDLHAGNALRSSDGWKAIDPKGVRADRHADVWALTDPLTLEDFPHDREQAEATAARRLELYADAAEMEPAKAREWTRIRAGAEAEEVGDDSAWAGALRRVAGALD
ncbi:MAG TPA: aminoglycoside phosphotransferase family protein [Thermoleophilaceae bacterium]|nr:aminoglycoside phosphotransferase family protein [Thermoleophilaceae bacterium]